MSENPIYEEVVAVTGIVPGPIYARCKDLVRFNWLISRPAVTPPRVGVKPVRKKQRK